MVSFSSTGVMGITMILILTILTNALEAIYEGLYDNGKKMLSGIIELTYRLLGAFTIVFITYGVTVGQIDISVWKLITGFIFVRFLIFDFTYNKTRGLPLMYIGSTKIYDKVLSKIPISFIVFIKFICGIVGTAFLLGLN